MENREGPDALAHLGSRETKYGFAYDPSVLEACPMPMRTRTTSSNSMALNSQASAPGRGSRISPIYISCIPDKRIGESRS